jgi:hypothetical protein
MASYSEMKTALDQISARIVENKAVLTKAKQSGQNASASLGSIPTDFAAAIAAIDAIPANTTNAAEMLLKAEKAKMATEFTALKNKADALAAVDLDS